jgi:hypothetical protein
MEAHFLIPPPRPPVHAGVAGPARRGLAMARRPAGRAPHRRAASSGPSGSRPPGSTRPATRRAAPVGRRPGAGGGQRPWPARAWPWARRSSSPRRSPRAGWSQPFEIPPATAAATGWPIPADRRRVRKIAAFRDWILAQAAADPLIARYRTLVAVALDDGGRGRRLEKLQERPGGLVLLAGLQQDGLLLDRRMVGRRHDPTRSARLVDHLRQGDEAQLRIAGGHILVGLGNRRTLDDLGRQNIVDLQPLHRLDRCLAIGRGRGVGDGELGELVQLQHSSLGVDQARRLGIQHQATDGVGEPRAGDAQPLLLGLFRPLGVGREEHLVRRAVGHLGVELARRAEAERRGVAGLGLEGGGDLLGRLGEVRGDGNLGVGRQGRRGAKRQGSPEQRQTDELEAMGDHKGISREADAERVM